MEVQVVASCIPAALVLHLDGPASCERLRMAGRRTAQGSCVPAAGAKVGVRWIRSPHAVNDHYLTDSSISGSLLNVLPSGLSAP